MSTTSPERPGLEGVVAFATEISEPDRDGGALRYRGVDLGELAGRVPFERVWGLLVDGEPDPGLEPVGDDVLPVRSGDPRADLQASVAMLTPAWGVAPLIDSDAAATRDVLARASATLLSFAAQSARSADLAPVTQATIDEGRTLAERFLLTWRGEADPADAQAIDAYWVSAAEHGMNASTFTARIVASTGADAPAALSAAIGALSGPLHGGAPSRVLRMLDEVERTGDAVGWVRAALDRGERLMGFGHRVYRAEDPRARVLRRAAQELGAPASRRPRRSSARRWTSCAPASPTACWPCLWLPITLRERRPGEHTLRPIKSTSCARCTVGHSNRLPTKRA